MDRLIYRFLIYYWLFITFFDSHGNYHKLNNTQLFLNNRRIAYLYYINIYILLVSLYIWREVIFWHVCLCSLMSCERLSGIWTFVVIQMIEAVIRILAFRCKFCTRMCPQSPLTLELKHFFSIYLACKYMFFY